MTVVDEVTDLLQHLIRNGCVNDGTPESGHEVRSTDLLSTYLERPGLDLQRYEALPGRGNLVARIEGSDPGAASLLLMGHTDVVPVDASRWRRDPFGGELVDGEVWGRGAIDMLNETAAMAVAFKNLTTEGWRPRGTLIYLAVADEEALGRLGAGWMLNEHPDAVRADYVLTESGGFEIPLPSRSGPKRPMMVGEKGTHWVKLRFRGTAGHGSMPFRTDNALVKAAEVVRRITEYQPDTDINDVWRGVRQPGRPVRRRRAHPARSGRAPLVRPGQRGHLGGTHGPRRDPHDVRPNDGPGRNQDQRHPRPRGADA